ncbi:MAG: FAD-dependent oxidoreductase [Actinobacteria bacterium]|nr:FAD-dependent oxidoreductase [Actinomycetota bacterium]MBU1942770.1 FAD-dependent oxidoreductase [Actinomycetota bacterium]MBU2686092.1 FAD-dependent oxidoreductase [Actinomycetota bacterium]
MVSFEPILKDKYEVIVIGAGIGGLCAAALLAREGLEVLVIEQSVQPGGCYTSFRIDDFTFDAAASILHGFGKVGFHAIRTVFDSGSQQVELIPRDIVYRLFLGDQRIDFHRDRHSFTAELGALYPQQAGSIFSFMSELDHIYQGVLECGGPPRPRNDESPGQRLGLFARHPFSVMRLSRFQKISAAQVLARHVDDPSVRSFFEADLIYNTGYPMDQLSAPHAALTIIDRHVGGTHHAIGSSQQIPDRLEKMIVEKGGRVLYRMPVERVLVEDGQAFGVVLPGDRVVLAEAVVADIGVRDLYERLVGRSVLRPETTQWLDLLEPSPGVMAIYLGIPETGIPEDFHPSTVLVDDPQREPSRFISISVPSLSDPYLSPEGYHTLSIHAVTDADIWPSAGGPEYGSEEYEDLKLSEGGRVLERVEEYFPGLTQDFVVMRVATPATFERYLLRENGQLAGPRVRGMTVPASLPGSVTEIRGLFLAGDSTMFGRGASLVAASGINCAFAVMRCLGVRTYHLVEPRESFVMETVPVRPEIIGQDVVDSVSAVQESHRCLRCVDSPCMDGCPGGIDIRNFIKRVSSADFAGAAAMIRENNPLGEVCGLVCPAELLCEAACRRGELDTPIRIGQLEAFTCGVVPGPEGWPQGHRGPRKARVAVIGSGPSGISCAYYLSLLGYNVEVFEQGFEAGGLPSQAIPSSRLDPQVVERELEGALAAGIEFRGNTTLGEDINFESLMREGFVAIFLGTGLGAVRRPEIRGADLPGVIDAVSFLEAARRRVKREMSRRVAVVGDGQLAMDTAVLARDLGADEVFLVTTFNEADMPVAPSRLAAARECGVEMLTGRRVAEIIGHGRVDAIRTVPTLGAAATVEGPHTGALGVGTVILAGERVPSPTLAGYLAGQLKLDEQGRILVGEDTMSTSRKGVFAGGDATGGPELIIEACARGRIAALAIDLYLSEKAAERRYEVMSERSERSVTPEPSADSS